MNNIKKSNPICADLVRLYVNNGLTVIPVAHKSKRPVDGFDLDKYWSIRNTDEEIADWFKKPNVGVGIVIQKGIIGIDIDRSDVLRLMFPSKTLEDLAKETWVSQTAKGFHIYFRYNPSAIEQDKPIFVFDLDGKRVVETYFQKHFFVEAPSIHDSGFEYRWLTDISSVKIKELTDAEMFVAEMKLYQRYYPLIEYCSSLWIEGVRNNFIIYFAAVCRKKGISKEDCKWIIDAIARAAGDTSNLNRECSRDPAINDTYKKPIDEISGYEGLFRLFGEETSKKILQYFPSSYKFDTDKYLEHDSRKDDAVVGIKKDLLVEDLMKDYTFLTLRDSGDFLVYSDGIYMTGGEAVIEEECEKRIPISYAVRYLSQYAINEIVGHIKRKTYSNGTNDGLADGRYLPLSNGIFDFKQMSLVPFTPEMFFRFKLPVAYDPAADCTKFKKILSDVFADQPEKISLLQEIFGYCLCSSMPAQKSFWFYGGGKNGKTTVANVLVALLGRNNVSSIDLFELENDRFALSELEGKLANILGEPNPSDLYRSNRFKKITGGDLISADRKNKSRVEFVNRAKMIIYANRYPKIKDTSDAFWRRVIVIGFKQKFEEDIAKKEVWKSVTDDENEMSGVLNWAIAGIQRLMNNNWVFTNIGSEDKKEFLLNANPKAVFVDEQCCLDPKEWTSNNQLWLAYSSWCDLIGVDADEKSAFMKYINNLPGVTDRRKSVDGIQLHGKKGIALKNLDDMKNTDKNDDNEYYNTDLYYNDSSSFSQGSQGRQGNPRRETIESNNNNSVRGGSIKYPDYPVYPDYFDGQGHTNQDISILKKDNNDVSIINNSDDKSKILHRRDDANLWFKLDHPFVQQVYEFIRDKCPDGLDVHERDIKDYLNSINSNANIDYIVVIECLKTLEAAGLIFKHDMYARLKKPNDGDDKK